MPDKHLNLQIETDLVLSDVTNLVTRILLKLGFENYGIDRAGKGLRVRLSTIDEVATLREQLKDDFKNIAEAGDLAKFRAIRTRYTALNPKSGDSTKGGSTKGNLDTLSALSKDEK